MHSTSFSFLGLLTLAFIGLMLLAGVGLLVYSIVAKRYWLTAGLLTLPLVLIGLLFPLLWLSSARSVTDAVSSTDSGWGSGHAEAMIDGHGDSHSDSHSGLRIESHGASHSDTHGESHGGSPYPSHGEVTDVRVTNPPHDLDKLYKYSATKPLTADIYPSFDLCARPLAHQMADSIFKSKQYSPKMKFTVTLAKAKNTWQSNKMSPYDEFVADFSKELLARIPNTALAPTDHSAEETEADANEKLTHLDLKLSHVSPRVQPAPGAIKVSWAIDNNPRSKNTVKYLTKPWVTNPEEYIFKNNGKRLFFGTTQRLARSREEAFELAMQDGINQSRKEIPRASVYDMHDTFVQKISLPYGDLWQAAVLTDVTPDHSLVLDIGASPARGQTRPIASLNPRTSLPKTSPALMLLMLVLGMFGIAWGSNLMTQGYYRSNINHTLVTAVLVVFGLMVLGLLMAFVDT